jgi:hypothetical protein
MSACHPQTPSSVQEWHRRLAKPGGRADWAPAPTPCPCSNLHKAEKDWRFARAGRTVTVMIAILCALVDAHRSNAMTECRTIRFVSENSIRRRRRHGGPMRTRLSLQFRGNAGRFAQMQGGAPGQKLPNLNRLDAVSLFQEQGDYNFIAGRTANRASAL